MKAILKWGFMKGSIDIASPWPYLYIAVMEDLSLVYENGNPLGGPFIKMLIFKYSKQISKNRFEYVFSKIEDR
jgi:hypothetical protein